MRRLVWDDTMKMQEVMYKMYLVPILTYASSTWTMGERDEHRIQAMKMKFLRSMAGKTQRDKIRNDNIRESLGIEKIQHQIERTRLRWFGHMKRMKEDRLPRIAFEKQLEGKRPRGKPRKRWRGMIEEDIKKRGLEPKELWKEEWWAERSRWRSIIHIPPTQS